MMEEQFETPGIKMKVESPKGCPFNFKISIHSGIDKKALCFEVTEASHPSKTLYYQLDDRSHASYLDFFEKLAEDWGLAVPLNRQPKPEGLLPQTAYSEVLTKNIHPEMLYGYGDPAVLKTEEEGTTMYYLLVTSNDAPNSFPILRSADLKAWDFVDFVFPEKKKPEWAADGWMSSDYWAPELHKVGDNFKLYYVARDKESHELCIGMAYAEKPGGPYTSIPYPILSGNVIDPHVYVEDDQTALLFWKEDNNDLWPQALLNLLSGNPDLIDILFPARADQITASFILTLWPWAKRLEPMERFQTLQILIEAVIADFNGFCNRLENLAKMKGSSISEEIKAVRNCMKTPMFAQRLSPDGTRLVGEKIKVLENDLEWEAHLVEGMWLTRHRDKYYLFYAGNDFSTEHYGIGVAVADSPIGPYKKMTNAFLQSSANWTAPGHPSVVTDGAGNPIMFLHAYFPGEAGYKKFRVLLSIPLQFNEDNVTVAT